MTRADYERLADERYGCGPDAYVARFDDPDREVMMA